MLTYAVVAYGDNKLVTAAPPIDPVDTVKFVHVMSWVIVDPDDTVKVVHVISWVIVDPVETVKPLLTKILLLHTNVPDIYYILLMPQLSHFQY